MLLSKSSLSNFGYQVQEVLSTFCLLIEDFSKYIYLLVGQCNCVRDVSDCRSAEDDFLDDLCSMSTVLKIVGSWKYYVMNIIYIELSLM
jgi:hypothetical protein